MRKVHIAASVSLGAMALVASSLAASAAPVDDTGVVHRRPGGAVRGRRVRRRLRGRRRHRRRRRRRTPAARSSTSTRRSASRWSRRPPATFVSDVAATDAVTGVARNHSVGTSRQGQAHQFVEERPDRRGPDGPRRPAPRPARQRRRPHRAARRPAVGHGPDGHRRRPPPRHRSRRDRGHHRHRRRRRPSRHRAQLRRRAVPQLHDGHPGDRRRVRGGHLHRPGRRRRGRARHPRGRHRRRRRQRRRHRGRGPRRHHRERPGRAGLGLLLPLRDGGGADLRRRRRARRGQHELLHRPVALQLRLARRLRVGSGHRGGARRAGVHQADDHRGARPTPTTRASRWWPRPATAPPTWRAPTRHDASSPDYPGGTEVDPRGDQRLPRPAGRGPARHLGVGRSGPSAPSPTTRTTALGVVDVAAPGGWSRDFVGTPQFKHARQPGPRPRTRWRWPSPRGWSTRPAARSTASRTRAATGAVRTAASTPTCRAPRWRRRTWPGSPPS